MKFEGLYLVEQDEENGKSVIYLFSRLKNGQKRIQKITNFRPYFYIPANESTLGLEEGGIYETIFGEKVKKVFAQRARDISSLRNNFSAHYEADIVFTNRFLIDEVDEIENSKYKIFYLDIETLSEGGFPDTNVVQQPIVCLTIYDNFKEKYITWIWRKDFHREDIVEGDIIKKFSSEHEMLSDVIDYIHQAQPDIITGWNVRFFDMKYLINRMNKLNLPTYLMSPLRSVYVTKPREGITAGRMFEGDPVVKGVVIFDMLNHYRKIHKGELSSYSLNSVATEELGEEKTSTHHTVDEDWQGPNWMNVVTYNKRDVELTVKLDKKTGLISFFDEMRTLAHANFDDCKYYGRIVDLFILRYAKKNNIVLPSKKPYNPYRELEGGLVREPQIGIHKNVIVIDLNQLYPTLIQTFNLSPEMRDEKGNININGIRFSDKKRGLIPSILDELFKIRVEYKKKMKELRYGDPEFKLYDAKQQAAKNLICTVYGVNALSTFRLNNDYVAQTITYLGRELNKWLAQEVVKKGHQVIYGDTDSVFIKIASDNFVEEGKLLAQELNERLGDFAKRYGVHKHNLSLDFEKAYKSILIGAKKRYAAWVCWKDGKEDDAIQIVGFDTKRSDSSVYSKNIQKDVIEMILKGRSKEEIMNYIQSIIDELPNQPLEDIAIPVKFEKNPEEYKTNIPRVRGAKYARKVLGVNYCAGNKVLMLYIRDKDSDCICFEDSSQFQKAHYSPEIDYDKLIEKLILMKVRRLLVAAGWEDEYNALMEKYVRIPRLKEKERRKIQELKLLNRSLNEFIHQSI